MTQEIWDLYPEIYHYTPFDSAKKILESKKLWARRFNALTDKEEVHYAKSIIAPKLQEMFPGSTLEDALYDLNKFYEAMGSEFYITSFVGGNTDSHELRDNGSPYMWKNYGIEPTGSGCAFIFRTQNIWDKTNEYRKNLEISSGVTSGMVMDEVVYPGHNDNNPDYRKRLSRYSDQVFKYLNNDDSLSVAQLCEDQLYLTLLSKNPQYIGEREVRRGLCFKRDGNQPLSSKDKYEIPFAPEKDTSRIIIGPHPEQRQRHEFLISFLAEKGLNIEVTKSNISLNF